MVTCFDTELQFRKVCPLDPSCNVEAGKAWRAKIAESSEIFSSDRSTNSTPSFADVVSHGDLFRTDSDAIMPYEKVIRRPRKHNLKNKRITLVGLTICKCDAVPKASFLYVEGLPQKGPKARPVAAETAKKDHQ